MRRHLLPLVALSILAASSPARGQSAMERTPNLAGGWTGAPGTLHFNFLHRFNQSGAPQRQVVNRPTFLLAWSVADPVLVGVHYATRSDLAPRYPNEWEVFARTEPLRGPVNLAVQVGYNVAAESFDGELSAARRFGPLRAMVAARAFSAGFAGDSARFAVAGGLVLRLRPWLALAGDAATLLDPGADEEIAWGAALQIAIPYTPHSLSLQAANTNTATLQGASRGAEEIRWGFEFTVPFTPARYFGRRAAPDTMRPTLEPVPPPVSAEEGARILRAAGDTVRAELASLAFRPASHEVEAGTTVVWTNADQVAHTVTAADGSWTSPLLQPGQSWARTFVSAGIHEILCTPHPFMRARVVVREAR